MGLWVFLTRPLTSPRTNHSNRKSHSIFYDLPQEVTTHHHFHQTLFIRSWSPQEQLTREGELNPLSWKKQYQNLWVYLFLFVYLLMAAGAFSFCGKRGLFIAVSVARWGMRDLPGPGIKPVSLTLPGRFFTTGPPGKSKYLWMYFQTSTLDI